MKRYLKTRGAAALILALSMVLIVPVLAQNRGTAEATIGGKTVSIDYGRPELRGRSDIHQQLPVGRIWRLGMNQATMLTTEADLAFGEHQVPKGSYSLFAKKVSDSEWNLVVNKQTGQWGTQYDASENLVEIPLEVETLDDAVDQFTIQLESDGNEGIMIFVWAKVALSAEFSVE